MTDRQGEFLDFARDLMRHLVKQDTLEEAGFFEYDREMGNPGGEWNNDTVVAVLQFMVQGWVKEHWGIEFEGYPVLDGVLAPPKRAILQEMGFLEDEQ